MGLPWCWSPTTSTKRFTSLIASWYSAEIRRPSMPNWKSQFAVHVPAQILSCWPCANPCCGYSPRRSRLRHPSATAWEPWPNFDVGLTESLRGCASFTHRLPLARRRILTPTAWLETLTKSRDSENNWYLLRAAEAAKAINFKTEVIHVNKQ